MPAVASVLAVPLSSGCAIDKGTALAADFEKDWAGTADVAGIHTTRNNTLPFSGTATGVLVLAEGASADLVSERAEALRDYVARHSNITGRITAGGITFTVVAEQRRTREVLALWRSLTADDQVVDGDINNVSRKNTRGWRSEITAADATGAMTVFKDMVSDGGRHRPLSDVTSLTVSSERGVRPGLSVGTGFDGTLPNEAIAAYEAVAAEHPVVSAGLHPDRLTVVVAEGADPVRAGELARSAAPGLGDAVEVRNDSGG
ncbi:hypothetical protein [Streptomyces sp. IB2014 016-6]|uniref:hypothetical protein n=1 Tax=Streptomyces sp. IB2014 016-6 TaxID=2517818 RepID=UPI00164EF7A3|nr:hypothetical protein [Streptomyces sp. IB2014 016-6]